MKEFYHMYLEQLHYLEVLSRYTSLSQASAALFISQPALSRTISNLEQELNLKLIQRTHKGYVMTEDGKAVAQYAAKISEEIQNIYTYAAKQNQQDRVYFTSVPGLCDSIIIESLSRFRQQYPDLNFHLDFNTTQKIIQSLNDSLSDFALISVPRNIDEKPKNEIIKNYETEYLFTDSLVYWIGAEHPLSDSEYSYNIYEPYLFNVVTEHNQVTDFAKNSMCSYSSSLYKNLIYCQDAILLLPRILGYKDPDIISGRILSKPCDIPVVMDYYFIKRKKQYLSKATNDFAEILLSLLFEYRESCNDVDLKTKK